MAFLIGSSKAAEWGNITGTLSAQTDLQAALDAKAAGPASSSDNELVRYDSTTGKVLQTSGVYVDDDGGLSVGPDAVTDPSNSLELHRTASGNNAILLESSATATNRLTANSVQTSSGQLLFALDANQDGQNNGQARFETTATFAEGCDFFLNLRDNAGTSASRLTVRNDGDVEIYKDVEVDGDLFVGGTSAPVFRVNESGSTVGVNVLSPQASLHVTGSTGGPTTVLFEDASTAGASVGMQVNSDRDEGEAGMFSWTFRNTVGSGANIAKMFVLVGSGTSAGTRDAGEFLFRTKDASTSEADAFGIEQDQTVHCYAELQVDGDLNHGGSNVGFFGTTPTTQQADIAALGGTLTGTLDNTLADVSGTGDDATVNKNIKELQDQVNKLRDILQAYGLMA